MIVLAASQSRASLDSLSFGPGSLMANLLLILMVAVWTSLVYLLPGPLLRFGLKSRQCPRRKRLGELLDRLYVLADARVQRVPGAQAEIDIARELEVNLGVVRCGALAQRLPDRRKSQLGRLVQPSQVGPRSQELLSPSRWRTGRGA